MKKVFAFGIVLTMLFAFTLPVFAAYEWGAPLVIDLDPATRGGKFEILAQDGIDYSEAAWAVLEVSFDGIDWNGGWFGYAGALYDIDGNKFGGGDFEEYGGEDEPLQDSYRYNLKIDVPLAVGDDGVVMTLEQWWTNINDDYKENVTGEEKVSFAITVLGADREPLAPGAAAAAEEPVVVEEPAVAVETSAAQENPHTGAETYLGISIALLSLSCAGLLVLKRKKA